MRSGVYRDRRSLGWCRHELHLGGRLGIAIIRCKYVENMKSSTMLHFNFAEIVQHGPPVTDLRKHLSCDFGNQNVAAIPTVHHSLGEIDSTTGEVPVRIDVVDSVHRSSVDTHAHLE